MNKMFNAYNGTIKKLEKGLAYNWQGIVVEVQHTEAEDCYTNCDTLYVAVRDRGGCGFIDAFEVMLDTTGARAVTKFRTGSHHNPFVKVSQSEALAQFKNWVEMYVRMYG